MALATPGSPALADAAWIALRKKHDEEGREFTRKIEAAREVLMARHQKEEREFWTSAGSKSSPIATKSTIAAKKSVARRGSTASTSKVNSRSSTPKVARRTQQPVKTAPLSKENAAKPTGRTARNVPKKAGPIEVIDLLSDDEDEVAIGAKTIAQSMETPEQKDPVTTAKQAADTTSLASEVTASKSFEAHPDAPSQLNPFSTSSLTTRFAPPGGSIKLFGNRSLNAQQHSVNGVKIEQGTGVRHSPQPTVFSTGLSNAFTHTQHSGAVIESPFTGATPQTRSATFSFSNDYLPSAASNAASSGAPLGLPAPRSVPIGSSSWATPPDSHQKRQQADSFVLATSSVPKPPIFGNSSCLQKHNSNVNEYQFKFTNPKHSPCSPTYALTPSKRSAFSPFTPEFPPWESSMPVFSPASPNHPPQRVSPSQVLNTTQQDGNGSDGQNGTVLAVTDAAPTKTAELQHQRDEGEVESMDVCNTSTLRPKAHAASTAPSSAVRSLTPGGHTTTDSSVSLQKFKRPVTPDSSIRGLPRDQSIAPSMRPFREQSIASTITMPLTPNTSRVDSCISAPAFTSRQSIEQATPTNRKRKTIDLSDNEDDGSDWSPGADEPTSPLGHKTSLQTNPVLKKHKTSAGHSASLSSPEKRRKYGFQPPKSTLTKVAPTTPSRAATKSVAPSTPTAPAKPSSRNYATPTTPFSPLQHSSNIRSSPLKFAQSLSSTSSASSPTHISKSKPLSRTLFQSPSKRSAARRAEDKIQGYFQEEQEFRTKSAIEDANAIEESAMFRGMRGMSLTPGARGINSEEVNEGAESLAMPSDDTEVNVASASGRDDASKTGKAGKGNCRRPTVRDAGVNGDEDEDEADISDDASDGNLGT